MSKPVFFPNYHIAVNPCLVRDVQAIGYEILQPDQSFTDKISFFAPSEPNSRHISYSQFMAMPPMIVIIPCEQHLGDLKRLVAERGNKDTIIYLTAGADSVDQFPFDTDFVLSHDLYYHRKSKAKYKMLYFNRPKMDKDVSKKDLRKCFDSKQINLYINNLYKGGFEVELPIIEEFSELWLKEYGVKVNCFGYDNPDGWCQPNGQHGLPDTHDMMFNSMFTLSPKRRETWGQNVNESMLMQTPVIVFEETLNSTFTEYLFTPDNCIKAKNAKHAFEIIKNMTFEEYETLAIQAQTMSELYCSDLPRQKQLKWLLDKASLDNIQ